MMQGEINSYADLSAPNMYATAADERRTEQADAIVERLLERYGGDALKAYLRLDDDDIGRDFDDDARDEADEQLWQQMSEGERMLAEVHQGPEAWLADASVMAAKYARHAQQDLAALPEWVEGVAA